MKWLFIIPTVLTILIILHFIHQSSLSQQGSAKGLINQKLAPCPSSPNCICTEFEEDKSHYLPPITLTSSDNSSAIEESAQIIARMGGVVSMQTDTYLSATFTSSLFKFVDDVELRWDQTQQQLHIRSASRVGHHDALANKMRVETFLEEWKKRTLSAP
jgi:uncharacterized protein (DUF1499 family)